MDLKPTLIRARHNPFSTSRVEQILRFDPALSNTSWERIETRWEHLHKRASIAAPHGSGKTTFIDAFCQRLTANGATHFRLFLNNSSPKINRQQWAKLQHCSDKIIILDGAEQLTFLQRSRFHRLAKNAAGLLVTCHRPHRSLPSLIELQPTIQTLETCIRKLAPDQLIALSPHLPRWWKAHNGNIREILLQCYDFVAQPAKPTPPPQSQ